MREKIAVYKIMEIVLESVGRTLKQAFINQGHRQGREGRTSEVCVIFSEFNTDYLL